MKYQAQALTRPVAPHQTPEHVCLGISPFNSYFTTPRMVSMIQWAQAHFDKIDFYIPDEAAAYTLQALGYEQEAAIHKARRQGNYLRNKIKTACGEAGLDHAEARIYDAARLRTIGAYGALHTEAQERFAADHPLREAIMSTSGWILDKRLPDGVIPSPEQQLLAVQYFLEELPMFIDTPRILGVQSSAFVYHQRVNFLERLFAHDLSWQPAAGQHFWVVQEEEAVALAS